MKKPVVLRIFNGEQLLEVKQFLEPQIVFGRRTEKAAENVTDLQVGLDGDTVAVLHASIEEREPGKFFVSDLGSASGTFKNGERVLDAAIESGDTLVIGAYRIEFFIGPPKPKATQPAPSATPPPPTQVTPASPIIKPVAPPPMAGPAPVLPVAPPVKPPVAVPPAVTSTVPPVSPPVASSSVASQSGPAISKPKPPSPPPTQSAATLPQSPQTSTVQAIGGGSFGLAGPKAMRGPGGLRKIQSGHGEKKSRKTFAPPSKYSDIRQFVKPSKGTVVELLVAWRERVISTHHFSQPKTITLGSHPDNDIVVPVIAAKIRKMPIVKIERQAIVIVPQDMRGEMTKGQTSSSFTELMRSNRLMKVGNGYTFPLDQGEMVRIDLSEDVAVFVRYVSDSPKPMVAPLLDLTGAETTGIVLAFALVATLWLYMYLYQPPKGLLAEENEPVRTAMIVLTPPTPPPPPPPQPSPEPPKTQPTPIATPPPQKIKVAEKTSDPVKKAGPTAVTNLTKKQDPGKSAAAAPNRNKTGPREQTSVKQGGSIKTAKTESSQLQSKPPRDVTKMGVFSAFGNKGQQDQLAQGTTGSGELAGMANVATGKTGSATDRAGKGLGSELKDTGVGGDGKALQGIAGGVGTIGRGSGNVGYGTGGLGNKAGLKIVTGGAGEEIPGTIDREAIRRVIRANLPAIRSCYERELNRKPDLFGKLVLSWDIGEQGRVLAARVKSNELGSDTVAKCVIEKLKTWRFPEPPANQVAEVAYPFLFSN